MNKEKYKNRNQADVREWPKPLVPLKALLVAIGLFFTLTASADDVYLWGTANGTRFYLKVEDPVKKTVQVHASTETSYSGDIIIPEEIVADDGNEYTIDLIDQRSFTGNTAITSISVPGTVTEIGQYTFSGCTSLKSVTLGEGVERIFKYAFENCTSLESITFPISTLYFEKETFTGCENVREVYLDDDNPRGVTGTDPFELIGPNATLFVPYGTENEYATLYGWKDFSVKPFLVLDEDKTLTLTHRVENIRTIFKRNIKNDKWNSFCIPFSLSAEDIVTVFGNGTRVLEFDPNSTESTLNFVDVPNITANKPCLIKPMQSWSTYIFKSLTVEPSAALTVSGMNYDFTGNYFNGYVPSGSYFISNNQFYKSVDETNKLKGYRAYITPASNDNSAKQMHFTINSPTGINSLSDESQTQSNNIYSIDGSLIRKNAISTKNLPKGVYIQGKKKILIK